MNGLQYIGLNRGAEVVGLRKMSFEVDNKKSVGSMLYFTVQRPQRPGKFAEPAKE